MLLDAVRRNPVLKRVTQASVLDIVKTWLCFSGDRSGGHDKRMRKGRTTATHQLPETNDSDVATPSQKVSMRKNKKARLLPDSSSSDCDS